MMYSGKFRHGLNKVGLARWANQALHRMAAPSRSLAIRESWRGRHR
jgi:hypothetical protein